MADKCELRAFLGEDEHHCDGELCIYWRVAGHLGIVEGESGCAIQYFSLLDGDPQLASWLLSVKDRGARPRADA